MSAPEIEDIEVIDTANNVLPDDLAKAIDVLKQKYGVNVPDDWDNNSNFNDDIDNTSQPEIIDDIQEDTTGVPQPSVSDTKTEQTQKLTRNLYNMGSITIPNGTIQYRKWRVKDKKNLEASRTLTDMKYALILNCIEHPNIHDIALDNEELNFVLHNIRRESVHKPLKHSFTCPECGHTYIKEIELDNIVNSIGGEYKTTGNITVADHNIVFGNPISQELYNEFMSMIDAGEFQMFITDMILHIRKFDNITVTNKNDIINIVKLIDEMDADIADDLVIKWDDIRYKVIIKNEVECPECGSKNKFNFEDLPGFYPSSWNDWNI